MTHGVASGLERRCHTVWPRTNEETEDVMDRDIETQRVMDLAALLANRTSPSRDLATRIAPTRRPVEVAAEVLAVGSRSEWREDLTEALVAQGIPRAVAEAHVRTEFGGIVPARPTLARAA
ncbi:MAG: hypothetical protein HC884_04540 [Chloroflexaceae bacterium]|nr:hypothetical protein [Chloroflexaceae bacterium]